MLKLMKIIKLLITFCFCAAVICCNQTVKMQTDDDVLYKCVLSATGSPCDTYYFEVDKEGKMISCLGEITDTLLYLVTNDKNIDARKALFLQNIEKQEERVLDRNEMNLLNESLSHIKEKTNLNEFYPGWYSDAWMVALFVGDRQFVFELSHHKEDFLGNFMEHVIASSPIVVKLNERIGGITPVKLDSLAMQEYEEYWEKQ